MRVDILALDGAFDTGLALVRDAFETARELAPAHGMPAAAIEARVVGLRDEVRTSLGAVVPTARFDPHAPPDWVLIPAIGHKQPQALEAALGRPDVKRVAAALREAHAAGARIAAACIGTFVLAESGLLDGEQATTTWWLAALFRRRYPQVRLEWSRMVVESGRVLTAGAALSHMDLALALLRTSSPLLADVTARYLVVDARPSQAAYAIAQQLASSDAVVREFERWARGRLHQGFSLEDAAAALAVSKRTLARRTQDALGKSPLAYFQDLRVQQAVHLLRTSSLNLARIAESVGYEDGASLAALLRRKLGRGVRELRSPAG